MSEPCVDAQPIVVRAFVYRAGGRNRKLKCFRLVEGPPYVMAHCGGDVDLYEEAALELFHELSRLGHAYSVQTKYIEVSMLEFLDL